MSDLVTKLGIQPGDKVALLDAPPALAAALEEAAPGAEFYTNLSDAPYELLLFWPTQLDGLAEMFTQLQRQIVPDGAIWAVIPKQQVARKRGFSLSWEAMQAAALQTDLVDNKIASVSDEEYATRFVIRKDRRGKCSHPAPEQP